MVKTYLNNVITIGMICESGEFKFFSVDHVTDPESLKAFEELEQKNSNNSISEKNSEQLMEKEEEDFVVETGEENILQGDYVKIVKEPFVGYFASVLEVIGDELELHYFQEKEGKPHGKYWVLAENDLECRPKRELQKVEPQIDWRGRFVFV